MQPLGMKRPKKILVLGSGALQIGQAGEFDYSGSQALKAFREENIETVLLNPNIATVQTDQGMADKVYFLPVQPRFVEQILEEEKCDAITLSFGGQSALNCGLSLEKEGVFERLGVKVLGTPVSSVRDTEDRHLFAERLREIDVHTARSRAVNTVEEALLAAQEIGYPVMLRSGFSLGGKGASIVSNEKECLLAAEIAFSAVSQILVEESLKGWKEIEYEVVRDCADNCITVCNIENVDPMGIHTGESIAVAPSQTLDDREYQLLRNIAIKTIRHLKIVGECNIQFALHPHSLSYRVIEVNARLSRSSALASKATGYPLAYVAAKLALEYTLPEIPNGITKVTSAFFEPALDYIVCKMPRWDLEKFDGVEFSIGSEMKSVGEVMAIGRTFPEVLQKAIRMLEIRAEGFDPDRYEFDNIEAALKQANSRRIFAIAKAFSMGMTVEQVHEKTQIDRFFLYEMARIIQLRQKLSELKFLPAASRWEKENLLDYKKAGFSDASIGKLLHQKASDIRQLRLARNIRPYLSQIDTLAAEYPTQTNFLYLTYGASQADIQPFQKKSVLVLGSGCYRIGSSVEFDWCAVNAVKAAKNLGYEPIMLNYNPETVSTDFDVCNKLIFDEITLETVLEICDFERPAGVIVAMGGQTPNNLVMKLADAGITILGTSAKSIHNAEERSAFSALLDELQIEQPKWCVIRNWETLQGSIEELGGYPVIVRPSYVLSGAAMRVALSEEELRAYLNEASQLSEEHPVVVSKFEQGAREIDYDAVAYKGVIHIDAICEHVEDAGVHSGDATLVFPPHTLMESDILRIKAIAQSLAKALAISGPFNIQMLVQSPHVKVIEMNLRASRSFPFVSKALGINFAHLATQAMLEDATLTPVATEHKFQPVWVKAAQFSFSRLRGADPRLGVEMASTGEVGCVGKNVEEALLNAMFSVGFSYPRKGVFVMDERLSDTPSLIEELEVLSHRGTNMYVSGAFSRDLKAKNSSIVQVDGPEHFREILRQDKVDWVISLAGLARTPCDSGNKIIRKLCSERNIFLTLEPWLAKRICRALVNHKEGGFKDVK